MDKQVALTKFFVRAVKHYVTEPIKVELIDGKAAPGGLGGCVGWERDHWRVMMGRNVSDWVLWKSLWHEAAHVVHGDTLKASDLFADVDRALIAGQGGSLGAARLEGYGKARDVDVEARCDAWGLERARQWLDPLNKALGTLADRITETTPEERAAKKAIQEAHLARSELAVRELEALARQGNKSAVRDAVYYRGEQRKQYNEIMQPKVIS